MERLTIRTVAIEAFDRYRLHFVDLLKVTTLPALAYAATLLVSQQAPEMNDLTSWMISLVISLIALPAALSGHRVVLLGAGSVPRWGVNGRQSRDWKFAGAGLVLLFVYYGLLFVIHKFVLDSAQSLFVERFGKPSLILAVLPWLLALYVLARLYIRLPAIACDRPLLLLEAWRLSRRSGLQLLILVAAPPLALNLVYQPIVEFFDADAAIIFVNALLFWLLFPLQIALLSIAYQKLSQSAA